jgi:phosphoribosylformylglycinamidine cyclo-ligase
VPGDVIVGLSSTGTASYEQEANSGIGSNGLTLARHAMISQASMREFPEIVDPQVDQRVAYCGPYRVTDSPAELGAMSVGEALASPTRTYAPVLARLFALDRSLLPLEHIHGVIHLTGGGQTKMLRFGSGNRYVKDALFPVPPLFQLIQGHSGVDWREMYQVFNMGHRLEIYLPETDAAAVIALASEFDIEARIIGHVENCPQKSKENELLLKSPHGEFSYSL